MTWVVTPQPRVSLLSWFPVRVIYVNAPVSPVRVAMALPTVLATSFQESSPSMSVLVSMPTPVVTLGVNAPLMTVIGHMDPVGAGILSGVLAFMPKPTVALTVSAAAMPVIAAMGVPLVSVNPSRPPQQMNVTITRSSTI